MSERLVPARWYYVSGAAWTTPQGPDDGGVCVATRASAAPIHGAEKDRNMRLAARAPEMYHAIQELVSAMDERGHMYIDEGAWDDFASLAEQIRKEVG